MKQRYISALLIATLSSYGFEVEDNKKFAVKAAPTQMSAGLSFSVNRSTQISVKSTLDGVLKDIKAKGNSACKGGEYYVYPISEYDQASKKTVRKGYEGSIRFECRFTDLTAYDAFLDFVNKQVKNKDSERVNIMPIIWELGEEEKEAVGERLKIAALEYTPRRSAEISRAVKAACELKKISFDNVDVGRYFQAIRGQSSKTETPIPETREIALNAHMLFECKK